MFAPLTRRAARAFIKAHSRGRAFCKLGPLGNKRSRLGGAAIPDRHLAACAHQTKRQSRSHFTKADDGYVAHDYVPFDTAVKRANGKW